MMVSSRLSSMMLPASDRPPVSSSSPVNFVSHKPSPGGAGMGKPTLLVIFAKLEQIVDVFLPKGLQYNNRVALRAC